MKENNKDNRLLVSKIEDSLYKSCIGYHVKETKAIKCKETYYDNEGRECSREDVRAVEVSTYIEPNVSAIALWLTNRKPEQWSVGLDFDMLEAYYNNLDK